MDYPFDYNLFLDFFYSDTWLSIVFWLKIFSGLASIILFSGIVILGVKTKKFWERAFNTAKAFEAVGEIKGKEKAVKKWQEIATRSASHIESDRKLSVIESDKFIDDIIKRIGFKGKDMADRLKQINANQVSNIEDVWRAHKIRNNLVHDPYFKLSQSDSDFVIKVYENTLKDLGIL